ncbi:EutP/PduV family microcompartment system protein [Lysinibacillus endophyticus]|uniref:EutP/PduV family microcompartment system protein n=1 Tax=Ureibacillus endophyticus TaxID=1978490 RepID=UPI0020A04964|nr:EutP/PduV family microcompartment system protein [Lysinibacillus endophyticus]MCP1146659.1 EutP/PduV family microcompartment system protein [Lysinibacillus endophyticus]
MNKLMIIGAVGSGKSTLTKALLKKSLDAVKTQALSYEDWIIDTPGEYLENPLFYKNIIATSFEATHIVYLQDATRTFSNFPPFFATGISKLPIGVITKCDADKADITRATTILKEAIGQAPIVVTSAIENIGVEHIRRLIQCQTINEMKAYVEQAKDPHLFF